MLRAYTLGLVAFPIASSFVLSVCCSPSSCFSQPNTTIPRRPIAFSFTCTYFAVLFERFAFPLIRALIPIGPLERRFAIAHPFRRRDQEYIQVMVQYTSLHMSMRKSRRNLRPAGDLAARGVHARLRLFRLALHDESRRCAQAIHHSQHGRLRFRRFRSRGFDFLDVALRLCY